MLPLALQLEEGPPQSGDFSISPTFFIVLMIGGFVIGVVGHLIKSRTLVGAGIAMIFAATFALPLALALTR